MQSIGTPAGQLEGDREDVLLRFDDQRKTVDELRKLVSAPQFLCTKCGRVANKKKLLCKPVKLRD